MRKPVAISGAIVTLAAGFAVASIATSGSLAAITHMWTVTTSTTRTVTTSTNPGDRHIEICRIHWNHHHHHRWFTRMVINQHSLRMFLRHGYILSPCLGDKGAKPAGNGQSGKHGDDDDDNGGSGEQGHSGSAVFGAIAGTSGFFGSHSNNNGRHRGRGHGH